MAPAKTVPEGPQGQGRRNRPSRIPKKDCGPPGFREIAGLLRRCLKTNKMRARMIIRRKRFPKARPSLPQSGFPANPRLRKIKAPQISPKTMRRYPRRTPGPVSWERGQQTFSAVGNRLTGKRMSGAGILGRSGWRRCWFDRRFPSSGPGENFRFQADPNQEK